MTSSIQVLNTTSCTNVIGAARHRCVRKKTTVSPRTTLLLPALILEIRNKLSFRLDGSFTPRFGEFSLTAGVTAVQLSCRPAMFQGLGSFGGGGGGGGAMGGGKASTGFGQWYSDMQEAKEVSLNRLYYRNVCCCSILCCSTLGDSSWVLE